MVSDHLLDLLGEREFSFFQAFGQELGRMEDFELSLGIFILECIETMGAHGDDAFDLVGFKAFHVCLYEFFE